MDSNHYVIPAVLSLAGDVSGGSRVLDIGCGNGGLAGEFLRRGCVVVGVDLSDSGIAQARKAHPEGRFEVLEADEAVAQKLGEDGFDLVVSTEVIEHLYRPAGLLAGAFAALRPGGRFVCSTPYHGYVKNLTLGLANRMDAHLEPWKEGGHIKFWSRRSLFAEFERSGFERLCFRGAGRVPLLWKSMVVSGDRPRSA